MKLRLLSLCLCLTSLLLGQVGGYKTFRFLDIPATSRAASHAGNSMAFWGDDINLLFSNPAALNPGMTKQLPLNFNNYVGDMNAGYVAYAHDLKDKGMTAGSIQWFNYGNFTGYDEQGSPTNSFRARDYALNLNYAKPLADSLFNVGICLKTIVSQYDVYRSFGNAIDFGITYHNKKDFVITLLAKNVGFVWKNYTSSPAQSAELPQTVQLGLSYKPAKAPFRFFVVYDQLLKWNLRYISPVDTTGKSSTLGSDSQTDSTSWQKFSLRAGKQMDNLARHVVFGVELPLSKNFFIRVAYNYRRQREMTLPDRRGANGLSFGFALKIKRFGFSYAYNRMAFGGNASTLGLTLHW